MYLCISTVVDFNSQNFDPPNEIWQIQPWMNIKKIPPHLACVATLPSETLISAKQAINDKLQCSESTSEKINQLRFDRIMVKSLWRHFLAHPYESSTRKKLPSIEDQGQTDSVTTTTHAGICHGRATPHASPRCGSWRRHSGNLL